jgi:hypothetical protein
MVEKMFWRTYEGAEGFLAKYLDLNNIVKVQVPKSILDAAYKSWPNLDGLGPAISFVDEGFDAFTRVIISIEALIQ